MAVVLLDDLITRAAVAADIHDNFVMSPSWVYWANVEHRALAVRLARLGFPYNLTSTTITITGSPYYYVAECLAVVGVYRNEADGTYTKLRYRSPANKIPVSTTQSDAREYTLVYNASYTAPDVGVPEVLPRYKLNFYPTPPVGLNYTIDTVPLPLPLARTEDSDGITSADAVYYPLNWDERIVLGMARRALAREETINNGLEKLISEIDSHIETSASEYVMAQNHTVLRVGELDPQPYFVFP